MRATAPLLFALFLSWIADCVHGTSDAEGDLACRELNPPFYGALEYNGSQVPANQQPSWRENDTVVFVCTRGYLLWGSSDQPLGTRWSITCEAPSTSGSGSGGSGGSGYGTWSENPQQFRCSPIDCGQPYSVADGSVSFDSTDLFSTAQYTCDPGHQLTGGASYTVCWWDEVWRPDTLSCTASPTVTVCTDPPTVPNGDRNWTAGQVAPVGATVPYSCGSGYQLDGATVATCDINGNWTAPPTCSASAVLSSTVIYIIEGAGAAVVIFILSIALCLVCFIICRKRIKQRQYIEGEEALANSGAFTLSNPLVKDEDAAGNPLYLTPDELNEFEQKH